MRKCALTRKAAEVVDKTDAHKRHQRERAATRKVVETADQADAHRMRKKEWVARRRVSRYKASESLDVASNAFNARRKEGPDYVCVSCHHLMYRQIYWS